MDLSQALELFDELSDLEAGERSQRLASLQALDPSTADLLERMFGCSDREHGVLDRRFDPTFLASDLPPAEAEPRVIGQAGQRIGAFGLVRVLGRGGKKIRDTQKIDGLLHGRRVGDEMDASQVTASTAPHWQNKCQSHLERRPFHHPTHRDSGFCGQHE